MAQVRGTVCCSQGHPTTPLTAQRRKYNRLTRVLHSYRFYSMSFTTLSTYNFQKIPRLLLPGVTAKRQICNSSSLDFQPNYICGFCVLILSSNIYLYTCLISLETMPASHSSLCFARSVKMSLLTSPTLLLT